MDNEPRFGGVNEVPPIIMNRAARRKAMHNLRADARLMDRVNRLTPVHGYWPGAVNPKTLLRFAYGRTYALERTGRRLLDTRQLSREEYRRLRAMCVTQRERIATDQARLPQAAVEAAVDARRGRS